MKVSDKEVRDALCRQYAHSGFDPVAEPVRGTYGLVWFFVASSPETSPQSFAVKTVDPARLASLSDAPDLAYLKREFKKWLAVPPGSNVVPALGIDLLRIDSDEAGTVVLPVMRMPRFDGSLSDWIGKDTPPELDRILALAQAFNGLKYLYDNGLEGHGDLKPSNLLYRNLKKSFSLPASETWPSEEHPWEICVADLGWADAWVDLKFKNKACREYLSPERLDPEGNVVPEKSDMYSMGIVAAELLQGYHPVGPARTDRDKLLRSEGKALRWAKKGTRCLEDIKSDALRDLVQRCLAPAPEDRPTAGDCIDVLSSLVQKRYPLLNLAWYFHRYRRPDMTGTVSAARQLADSARNTFKMGGDDAAAAIADLEHAIAFDVIDLSSAERWAILGEQLISCLSHEAPAQNARVSSIRADAHRHLCGVLGRLDRGTLSEQAAAHPHSDGPSVLTFERLANALGQMAELSGVRPTESAPASLNLSLIARAAWAFSAASWLSQAQAGSEAPTWDQLLEEAIGLAPDEPVLLHFRAYWGFRNSALADSVTKARIADWILDAESAARLSPSWSEPRALVEKLRQWDTEEIG